MTVYESGRESSLLDDIKAGRKTIECRLNRGKFARYQPGDFVWLRRDIYQDGGVVDEVPHQQLVRITAIEQFGSFFDLIGANGVASTVPRAQTVEEAVAECHKYYSPENEAEFGVLAIHFRLADSSELVGAA